MIVILRLEFDDAFRRMLRRRHGQTGLATRRELRLEADAILDGVFTDYGTEDTGDEDWAIPSVKRRPRRQ